MMQFASEFAGFIASVAPIIGMAVFTIIQISFERDLKKVKRGLNWAVLKIHDKLDD